MNKKKYLVPTTETILISTSPLLAGSITSIGGDTGIVRGDPTEEDPTPISGDSRRTFSVWDD